MIVLCCVLFSIFLVQIPTLILNLSVFCLLVKVLNNTIWGKVYSGLYECSGHVVPYLVLVKMGKPTERSRLGNQGKQDSQMLIMHFLNKVCVTYSLAHVSFTNLFLLVGSLQFANESVGT